MLLGQRKKNPPQKHILRSLISEWKCYIMCATALERFRIVTCSFAASFSITTRSYETNDIFYFHHVKRPIQSLVRHLGWNSLRVLTTSWAHGLSLLEAAPRMFEWVLNTPLIPLKLLSLSTICEEAYSEPSQTFGMDVSARVVGLSL